MKRSLITRRMIRLDFGKWWCCTQQSFFVQQPQSNSENADHMFVRTVPLLHQTSYDYIWVFDLLWVHSRHWLCRNLREIGWYFHQTFQWIRILYESTGMWYDLSFVIRVVVVMMFDGNRLPLTCIPNSVSTSTWLKMVIKTRHCELPFLLFHNEGLCNTSNETFCSGCYLVVQTLKNKTVAKNTKKSVGSCRRSFRKSISTGKSSWSRENPLVIKELRIRMNI